MKFKVIDPKGIHRGAKHLAPGDTFTSERPHGTLVNTFLHFKQIEEVPEKPAKVDEPEIPAPPVEAEPEKPAEPGPEKPADDKKADKKATK
jgi:hypothetical protein